MKTVPNLKGGLKKYNKSWEKFTKDPNILGIITEVCSGFIAEWLAEIRNKVEISKLLEKRVIVKSKFEFGDYIFGVFTRGQTGNTI